VSFSAFRSELAQLCPLRLCGFGARSKVVLCLVADTTHRANLLLELTGKRGELVLARKNRVGEQASDRLLRLGYLLACALFRPVTLPPLALILASTRLRGAMTILRRRA
jgi:hypothetical protein